MYLNVPNIVSTWYMVSLDEHPSEKISSMKTTNLKMSEVVKKDF